MQKTLSDEETAWLSTAVEDMLEAGAIYKTERKDVVLSSIYTVVKKGTDKRRPVINLRWVNTHINTQHFKMTTMRDVKAAMTQGCYMAKIDLKDAFWQCPVDPRDQRFLSFRWKGVNYSFRCLPFGLSVSPLLITKLYKPVVAKLQAMGHKVMIYLDDLLLLGRTKQDCQAAVQASLELFKQLGVVVNDKKCSLVPSQVMEYLGFELDSTQMSINVPSYKIKNLKNELRRFINRPACSARSLASLLGKVNSLADALFPVRVHTTGIHQLKLSLLRRGRGWDFESTKTTEAISDAQWWVKNLTLMNGVCFLPKTPDIRAGTDASKRGWGAWVEVTSTNGTKTILRFGGHFSTAESELSINELETQAVIYLLRSCPELFRGKVVDLGIDNTTTIWYIRKFGGRKKSMAHLATEIFEICQELDCHLQAFHVPGVENIIADEESRRLFLPSEFKLNPSIFRDLNNRLGPHSIDAFASYQNRQLERYASWQPQPGATWVNAMNHSWVNEHAWVNPPFALLSRILQKVRSEKSTITLIAPLWQAQPWFVSLLEMASGMPVVLPSSRDLFLAPSYHGVSSCPRWITAAWTVSGVPSAPVAFRRRLSTLLSRSGSSRLVTVMTNCGRPGRPSHASTEAALSILRSLSSLPT